MKNQNQETAEIKLNRPQMRIALMLRFLTGLTAIWGRGTGKSFLIALIIRMIVRTMPGSTWAIQGATFVQLLDLTLPGTLDALERFGYILGKNYVFGRQLPAGWNSPYRKILKPERTLIFFHKERCVAFQLISQDREGMGRGPSFDGVINDESLTLDVVQYQKETKATNRGNEDRFGKLPYHHAEYFFTSMPYGQSGQWLLKKGNYYEQDGYDFRRLCNSLVELQLDFLREKAPKLKLEVYTQYIMPLQSRLKFYKSKTSYLYSEANVFENLENLGLRYIQSAFDDSADELLFLVEYLNKAVETITGSFYPALDKSKLGYRGKFDYDKIDGMISDGINLQDIRTKALSDRADVVSNHPLELGLDFGKINWIVVAQYFQSINRINFVDSLFVKSPKIIDDMAEEFCRVYAGHVRKVAHIWPDAMGNDDVANAKLTYTEQFCNILRDKGWTVIVKNKGKKQPEHHRKYLLWAKAMMATIKGDNRIYPTVRFNLVTCKLLVASMENTPAKDNGNGLISKDKSSEQKLSLADREHATDSTDAADQIMYGLFKHLVKAYRPTYHLVGGQ